MFSMLLALCLLLALLPVTAQAAWSGAGDGTSESPEKFAGFDFNDTWYRGGNSPQLRALMREVSTWTELQAALTAGGDIILTADVTPENPYWADALTVHSGVTAALDLNGHTVNRGYTEQGFDGSVIKIYGTLTVTDSASGGSITGGFPDQYGGGVQIQGGTFNLQGGSITGNSVGKTGFFGTEGLGGGVYMQSGTFNMSGGTITGNTALGSSMGTPLGRGGGVYITEGTFHFTGGTISGNDAGAIGGGVYVASTYSSHDGRINASGGATVTDNTVGGADSNVYLEEGGVITVEGALTGTIGVTMQTPGVFTSGLSGNGTEGNFTSDDASYGVARSGAEAALLASETTPAAVFAATGYDTGTLTGLADGGHYTVSGAATADFTLSGATVYDLAHVGPGTLAIVKKGDGVTTADSPAQNVTVTRAATPDLAVTQPTAIDGKGSVETTAAHEWSSNGMSGWEDCDGPREFPQNCTVFIRVKASGSALASDAQELTVVQYVAPPSIDWTPALVTEVNSGATLTSAELDRLIREGKTLTVATEDGAKVELSSDALKDIAGQTSGSIRFDLTKEQSSGTGGTGETDTKAAYDLTVSAGGKTVDFGGKVNVIPAEAEDASSTPARTASITAPDGSRHFVVSSEPFPYTDVSAGSYCYDAVDWADLLGITEGTAPDLFGPDGSCTRAQTVTFLWRAAGCPEPVTAASPYTDLDEDAYYYKAVLWAFENGITLGTGDGRFDPGGTVDRAQSVTFLYRALHGSAVAGNGFADVAADAYYYEAVLWAAENGITLGTGDGNFSPDDDCLRAQIVTFLWRAYSEG